MKRDWLDDIVEKTYQHYNKRKIVLWGKYPISDSIQGMLKERYGIEAAFYVDGNEGKIDHYHVFSPQCLVGKSQEYYLVIPVAFYQSLKDKLTKWGYKKDADYYYFADCIVCHTSDYYEDSHGNKIVGIHQGLKFAFSGFNSEIRIGKQVHFYESTIYIHSSGKVIIGDLADLSQSTICAQDGVQISIGDRTEMIQSKINAENHSEVIIGEGCFLGELPMTLKSNASMILGHDTKIDSQVGNWSIFDGAKVEIGSRGRFIKGYLVAASNSLIKVGNDFSIMWTYQIVADEETSIIIGDDCMASYDVMVRSGDGHSIFDLNTGENMNSTKEISKLRKTVIGNHVWIGMRSIILYRSEIGSGSIIGAASLVKSTIPNNCIAAGTPAKVKKENIAWEREYGAETVREMWDFRE